MVYKRALSDDEVKLLSHDLLDITTWIDGMIQGKINACLKRAAQAYREMLRNDGALTAPLSDLDCALAYFNQMDYKNRANREQAQKNVKGE